MNKEQIIEMARGAGLLAEDEAWVSPHQEAMERFAALVAAEKEKQIFDILERLQERNNSHNYYAYAINVITGNI